MDTFTLLVLVVGVFSVFTNGILLIVLFLDPLKKFRTTTNYFIISLTISDFFTGVAACTSPLRGLESLIMFGLLWASILSSFFTIFLMSCERLVVVMYPLKAKHLITKRRVLVLISGNWVVSITLGAFMATIPPPDVDYLELPLFTVILVLVLFMIVIYLLIIWRTKHKPRFIRESIRARSMRFIQQERRLTGVLFLLVAILMVTVVPYVAVMAVYAVYRMFGNGTDDSGFLAFSHYFFPIELINFVVNPIIYAWRLPTYRRSLYFYLTKLPFFSKRLTLDASEESSDSKMVSRRQSAEKFTVRSQGEEPVVGESKCGKGLPAEIQ